VKLGVFGEDYGSVLLRAQFWPARGLPLSFARIEGGMTMAKKDYNYPQTQLRS
jgi:hypothetical protein